MITFPADRSPRGTGSGVAALPASRVLQKVPYTRRVTRYVRRLQNGIFEWEVKALPAGKLFPRPLFPRTACPAERVPEVAILPTSRRGRWQRESAPGGLDGKVDSPEAVELAPAPGARPRKSQLRLRKRLVSAVQSRHSREAQKCDPGATLRLEKAGPPR